MAPTPESDENALGQIAAARRTLAERERAAAEAREGVARLEMHRGRGGYRGAPAPGVHDPAPGGPAAGPVLLLCQLPTALTLVAAVVDHATGVFDGGGGGGSHLYGVASIEALLLLASAWIGWRIDRRARGWLTVRPPSIARTWWRLQALGFVAAQLAAVFAGVMVKDFSLRHPPSENWSGGVREYLAVSGVYVAVVALPLLVPAWLMVRRGGRLRLGRWS